MQILKVCFKKDLYNLAGWDFFLICGCDFSADRGKD